MTTNMCATYWLAQAADQPHSFYGLLAANLLGRDNQASWQVPALDKNHKAILVSHPAGWRALALIQIGQTALGGSELEPPESAR